MMSNANSWNSLTLTLLSSSLTPSSEPSHLPSHLQTMADTVESLTVKIDNTQQKIDALEEQMKTATTEALQISLGNRITALIGEKTALINERKELRKNQPAQGKSSTYVWCVEQELARGNFGRGHRARRFTTPLLPLLTSLA